MAAPLVFFDIAGPDTPALNTFFRQVFDWNIAEDGSFSIDVLNPLGASLRPDPADKFLYFGVVDVKKSLEQIVAAGGSIDTARFEVPGTVVLGLFSDPAGNRFGLVELENGTVKIP